MTDKPASYTTNALEHVSQTPRLSLGTYDSACASIALQWPLDEYDRRAYLSNTKENDKAFGVLVLDNDLGPIVLLAELGSQIISYHEYWDPIEESMPKNFDFWSDCKCPTSFPQHASFISWCHVACADNIQYRPRTLLPGNPHQRLKATQIAQRRDDCQKPVRSSEERNEATVLIPNIPYTPLNTDDHNH